MGTHMWSSAQVSRRGRRMSLELPPGTVPPVGGRGPLGVPSGGHPPHPTGVPPPPPTGLPPIPMNAKDSEFLRGRPDLFYPYLQHQTGGTHPSTQFNNGATPPIIPPPAQVRIQLLKINWTKLKKSHFYKFLRKGKVCKRNDTTPAFRRFQFLRILS